MKHIENMEIPKYSQYAVPSGGTYMGGKEGIGYVLNKHFIA